jgi:hypothetical protein
MSTSATAADESEAPERHPISKFFSNGFVQGVIFFIALGTTLSGKLDQKAVLIALVFAGAVGAFGIYTHTVNRTKWGAIALVTTFSACMVGLYFYLTAKHGSVQDTHTQQASPLPTQAPPSPAPQLPSKNQTQNQRNSGGTNTQQQSAGDNSPNISAPGGIANNGPNLGSQTITNNYPMPTAPKIDEPELSVRTARGLTISDFPDSNISSDMLKHMRRHTIVLRNPNAAELQNVEIRFQLPEYVVGKTVNESTPAGVSITWHPCRMPMSFDGSDGASVHGLPDGGIQVSTGSKPGSYAGAVMNREVCSESMENSGLATKIYKLQIERVPALAIIQLGFMTTDDPGGPQMPPSMYEQYCGGGTWQFNFEGRVENHNIFVPLSFDEKSRAIISEAATEDAKRKCWGMLAN